MPICQRELLGSAQLHLHLPSSQAEGSILAPLRLLHLLEISVPSHLHGYYINTSSLLISVERLDTKWDDNELTLFLFSYKYEPHFSALPRTTSWENSSNSLSIYSLTHSTVAFCLPQSAAFVKGHRMILLPNPVTMSVPKTCYALNLRTFQIYWHISDHSLLFETFWGCTCHYFIFPWFSFSLTVLTSLYFKNVVLSLSDF